MLVAVAEIIDFESIVRARARRRARVLTTRCLGILEDSLADSQQAYRQARAADRPVWARKIRQLEDLITYATHLV